MFISTQFLCPLSLPWSSSLSPHPPEPQEPAHTLSWPIEDRQVWTILSHQLSLCELFHLHKEHKAFRRRVFPSQSSVSDLSPFRIVDSYPCYYKPVKPDSSFLKWLKKKKNICLLWKWQAMQTAMWKTIKKKQNNLKKRKKIVNKSQGLPWWSRG